MGAAGGAIVGAIPALVLRAVLQATLVRQEAMNWCKVVAGEIEEALEGFCTGHMEKASARILGGPEAEPEAEPVRPEGQRFQASCPGCRRELMVPAAVMGKQVKCPKCSTVFMLEKPEQ